MATYHNGALNKSSEGETLRFTLRRAWSKENSKKNIGIYNRAITPFRAINNAGDYLSRVNYSSADLTRLMASSKVLQAHGKHQQGEFVLQMTEQILHLQVAIPNTYMIVLIILLFVNNRQLIKTIAI